MSDQDKQQARCKDHAIPEEVCPFYENKYLRHEVAGLKRALIRALADSYGTETYVFYGAMRTMQKVGVAGCANNGGLTFAAAARTLGYPKTADWIEAHKFYWRRASSQIAAAALTQGPEENM